VSGIGRAPTPRRELYIAAYAPDADQTIGDLRKAFPKTAGLDQLQPQADGYLLLSAKGIEEDFAQDLTPSEKALLVATQLQTNGSIFEAKPGAAAWRSKPAWYVLASNDHMISPEHEESMAKQIKATTIILPASHAVMLSHPKEVAKVIEEAAGGRLNYATTTTGLHL